MLLAGSSPVTITKRNLMKLYVDIETYCDLDLLVTGVYKYVEDPSFEILLISYTIDNGEIYIIDLTNFDNTLPFLELLNISEKHAHNAQFERICLNKYFGINTTDWRCTMVKSAFCGLPLVLESVSEALELGELSKDSAGKALVRYFCQPCKPSKTNGQRLRNLPFHDPEKWENFKNYCKQDVEAERAIDLRLSKYEFTEQENYLLDQKINDFGVRIDLQMAQNAVDIDAKFSSYLMDRIRELTGIDNPNSPAQLKKWLSDQTGQNVSTLAKDAIPDLIELSEGGAVKQVLELRQKLAKTSIKKYQAMIDWYGKDERVRGVLQFYGASRTGRYSGRAFQPHNLPRNYLPDLDNARNLIKHGDFELIGMLYSDVPSILSQLIRTALIPAKNKIFNVADFSAIEARVLAWLAGEEWRLEVFRGHGKIYEASASMMFNIPIEKITKDSSYRQKGKVAELALGYQGSVDALKRMGAESMGLTDEEMKNIVNLWRKKSPKIKKFWSDLEGAIVLAVKNKSKVKLRNLIFESNGEFLTIQLPSGRKSYYYKPRLTIGRYGNEAIKYMGVNQETKQWGWVDSYGGKFAENVTQAIARDLLAEAMQRLDKAGFNIAIHVHDEAVCEEETDRLKEMCRIAAIVPDWAKGLPMGAEGFVSNYYKK